VKLGGEGWARVAPTPVLTPVVVVIALIAITR
jgi:hypothetical protein